MNRTMQGLALPETIAFGPFLLDPAARALLAGGGKCTLSSRAFDILALLIAERDRVVSKDEIIGTVWRGVAVEENNLAVQMSALRRALAEHAPEQTMIVTVPGQGYRFVGRIEGPAPPPLTDLPPPPPPALPRVAPPAAADALPSRTRVPLIAGVAAVLFGAGMIWFLTQKLRVPEAPRLSIAVLPFRNLSEDRKEDYLADAISDDLTTDLSHLPGSVVIARESSDVYKGRAVPAQQIGRALNVRYLLEGSLRNQDGIFHVNAQLIDASNGAHLGAETFDVARSQISEAQASIVRRIASTLDVQLVAIESERSRRERQDNPDAFDYYLRARSARDAAQSIEQMKVAQELFEQSLKLQPDYVDAMADLALLLMEKTQGGFDPDGTADFNRGQQLVNRALSLDPRNINALLARALEQNLDGKLRESEASLRAALEIDPNNLFALTRLGQDEWRLGRPKAASEIYEKTLRLDPQGPNAKQQRAALGAAYFMEGRFQESIEALLASLAGDATESSAGGDRVEFSNMMMIAAYDRAGNRQEAEKLYQNYKQHWPHRSIWRLEAFFSKAQATMPGFQSLTEGLKEAGMPMFEQPPAPAQDGPATATSDEFSLAPAILRGAQSIAIAQLQDALRQSPKPIILDVGIGAATLEGSVWIQDADSGTDGIEAHLAQAGRDRPIIIVGDGYYGRTATSAVTRAVASGHRRVAWLIGGEEGLAEAGYNVVDRRTP